MDISYNEILIIIFKLKGSTYGAAWRPATPFYNYVPPPPPNWAEPAMQMAASPRFGPFRKNLKVNLKIKNIFF